MRASKQRLSNNGVVAVLRKPVLVLALRLRKEHQSVTVPGIVKKYEGNLSRFSRPTQSKLASFATVLRDMKEWSPRVLRDI